MPVTNYIIRCCTPGCPHEAAYKIASRWSDGLTSELKTYALCCEECLSARFRDSHVKQSACRLSAGETLDSPGIYRLRRGERDRELVRLAVLEAQVNN